MQKECKLSVESNNKKVIIYYPQESEQYSNFWKNSIVTHPHPPTHLSPCPGSAQQNINTLEETEMLSKFFSVQNIWCSHGKMLFYVHTIFKTCYFIWLYLYITLIYLIKIPQFYFPPFECLLYFYEYFFTKNGQVYMIYFQDKRLFGL